MKNKNKKSIFKKILFILYILFIIMAMVLPTFLVFFINIPGFIISVIALSMFFLGAGLDSVIFWVYEDD